LIFDSEKIKNLIKTYANQNQTIVPSAVFLARSEKCSKEREYLEELISYVPTDKQKYWLDNISSENEISHLSSWFEMMLYGWLRQIGTVEVEPEVNGKRPDFCVTIQGNRIFFEAKVRIETKASSKKISVIRDNRSVPKSFARFLDPEELKSLLTEKIKQHKGIHKLGHAYVICVFASIWMTTDVVKEAIFGRECGILNKDYTEIIDVCLDKSGLFSEDNDLSKTVTAFLIFESRWDKIKERRIIRADIIHNPLAEVQIDSTTFNIEY